LQHVVGVKSDKIILPAMIVVGVCFGLWFIRYAKILWLAFDLTIHPPSRDDYEQRDRNKAG